MHLFIVVFMAVLVSSTVAMADAVKPVYQHELEVAVIPTDQTLNAKDTIHLPFVGDGKRAFEFYLNAALVLESEYPVTVSDAPHVPGALPMRKYRLTIPPKTNVITVKYQGRIQDPLSVANGEPRGEVSSNDVFLASTSGWYPLVDGALVSFNLQVSMPQRWKAVSQGQRLQEHASPDQAQVVWRETNPQDEIYLIAAPFHEFSSKNSGYEAMVFLRQDDQALAKKYLDATTQYIDMYHQLIGPYPYAKFALVENTWETGYGMPSFTLLGSKVIRLPFIITSSYPHEILHNWWGNSVYVDYEKGNWSEGLTSYLADYLFQEQRGNGAAYRRDILQSYADYVSANRDFPLTSFTARHNSSSAAVGYGKSQMLFHMLRHKLGDEKFLKGLREFYRRYQFKTASFSDLARVFSEISGQPQADYFNQWIKRTGAPAFELSNVTRKKHGDKWQIQGVLRQTQNEAAFVMQVPLAVTLAGQEQAWQGEIEIKAKENAFVMEFSSEPLRLDVDPEFDVFRRVSRSEIPPALSQLFGTEKMLMVLPSNTSPELTLALQSLIDAWRQEGGREIQVRRDNEIEALPEDLSVWLLGADNRFAEQMLARLENQSVVHQDDLLHIQNEIYDLKTKSVVMVARSDPNSPHAIAWLATRQAAAVPGLARKLPHYGKYSYLIFTGSEPTNIVKGQWPVVQSPLSVEFQSSRMATLRPRAALQ